MRHSIQNHILPWRRLEIFSHDHRHRLSHCNPRMYLVQIDMTHHKSGQLQNLIQILERGQPKRTLPLPHQEPTSPPLFLTIPPDQLHYIKKYESTLQMHQEGVKTSQMATAHWARKISHISKDKHCRDFS